MILKQGDVIRNKATNNLYIVIQVTDHSYVLLPAAKIKAKFYVSKELVLHDKDIEVI